MEFNKKVRNTKWQEILKSYKAKIVIINVVIVVIMLMIGLGISAKIRQSLLKQYQVYDSALKIQDVKTFKDKMKANAGYAFVYGELKALDPVSYPELTGEYSYLKKEEQVYRNHVKRVKKIFEDRNGEEFTKIVKEDNWTWDTLKVEFKKATKISFLGVEFAYDKIPFPSSHKIEVINLGYYNKCVYYGTETNFKGTIFTYLENNTIGETRFYQGKNISETIQELKKGTEVVIFWVFWVLITVVISIITSIRIYCKKN